MRLFQLDEGGATYWIRAIDEVEAFALLRDDFIANDYFNENELEEVLSWIEISELDQKAGEQIQYYGEYQENGQWKCYTCSLWEQYQNMQEDGIISCSEWP